MSKSPQRNLSKNIQSSVLVAVLVASFTIFISSSKNLIKIHKDYSSSSKLYDSLIDLAVEHQDIPSSTQTSESLQDDMFQVNFEPLQAINPQVIAWIRFDAPQIINYPLLHSGDNETYLHSNIYEESSSAGCLFVQGQNSADFSDDNTVIFGHNMKNGSMFGKLSSYADQDFYEDNPYFYIYTPDADCRKYQVLAVSQIPITDTWRFACNFSSDKDFHEYIHKIMDTADYETATTIPDQPKLITLSTCTSSDEYRFVVHAVYVEKE